MKKENEVVYAFIDSQNLNLGVRSQGWKLDFGKFRQYLITKYHAKKYSSLLRKFAEYIVIISGLKGKLTIKPKQA